MQLVTFLRSIYYRRCVYFVFLVSVPIATPYESIIARPTDKNKNVPLPPEVHKEIYDYNNEHMYQDVPQPQFRHESTVDPKINIINPPQLKLTVESPENFIWFIHNVIKILSTYSDKDLKHFFQVINTEVERYEKSKSNHLSRFLSSVLSQVKNISAVTLGQQLLAIDASMGKETQEKSQKQLTDHINTLYGTDYVEKFLIFLFNIDDYKFMVTKNIDLGLILRNGLKSLIFDPYNKLDNASKETFISSIKSYFRYITKSPSLIGGDEEEDVDEKEFKLSGGNNQTAIRMKRMLDENVKGTIKANNYKEETNINKKYTKKPSKQNNPVTMATVDPTVVSNRSTVTHQSKKTQFSNSQIITLGPVNVRSLLTKKATLKLTNTGMTTSKRNIFIDIEYSKHLKGPLENKVQRKRNKPLIRTDSKYTQLSTTKHSNKRNDNVPAESTYKTSREESPILAKRFDLSAPHKIKEKVDYRRNNDGNETANKFEIKKKVLARLYQLENEIKLVKSQIHNDSRTIKDLENQIHQKEKERAKLNLIKGKKHIMEKYQTSDQNAMRRKLQRYSSNKITESDRFTSNFYQVGKNNVESTSDKIFETKQNTSYGENVPNFQGTTLNIFDQLDDVKYETFENYDGKFDWEKFVTSYIYLQQLNSSTADIADGRRMLDEELTTPPIEALEDNPEYWYELGVDNPQESTIFTPPPLNGSLDQLVPKPGYNAFIDSMGISIETPDPLNMQSSEDTQPKFNFPRNLKFGLRNGRKMLPDESRRNMYTSTRNYDKILDDPIIRDIDKAVEF